MFSLILSLFFSLNLNAQSDCRMTGTENILNVVCGRLAVEQTSTGKAHRMLLNFTDGFGLELRVVNFPKQKQLLVTQSSRTQAQLTASDLAAIREVHNFLEAKNLEKKFFLIEFFKNLPRGESLLPLVDRSDEIPWPHVCEQKNTKADLDLSAFRSYTLICESLGQELDAIYRLLDVDIVKTVIVGDPETDCYGRCGFDCSGSPTYTQECLNHDACHRDTGENLGVCSDYFWDAADGYLWAAPCDEI